MNDYKLSEGKILDRSKLAKYEHLVKIPEKKGVAFDTHNVFFKETASHNLSKKRFFYFRN